MVNSNRSGRIESFLHGRATVLWFAGLASLLSAVSCTSGHDQPSSGDGTSEPSAPPTTSPADPPGTTNPAYSETVLDSGDGWQKMRITGTAADDDGASYDSVVYTIQGPEGAMTAPLPQTAKDEIAAAQLNDPEGSVYIIDAEIADEIATAEMTGVLSPRLQAIAEPLAETSSDWGGPKSSAGKCDPQMVSKSKTLNLNVSSGTSINLASGFNGKLTFGLDASGGATGEVQVEIKRKGVLWWCIPYGARFDHARVYGVVSASTNGDLDGSISTEKHWKSEISKPSLGALDFWAGPIPIHIGFNLPINVGLDLKAEAMASLHYQAKAQPSGSFDYTCTLDGCSGWTNFNVGSSANPAVISAAAQLRAQPSLWGQVAVRAFLYNEWLAYAQLGFRPTLLADLWGYAGNGCGDADGDGTNETVAAATLDLDAQGYLTAAASAFGGDPREWNDLWHTNPLHLGYLDPLGSSALTPMLSGPSVATLNASQQYFAKMRPCWPYIDDVNYVLTWGDGSSSSFTSSPQSWSTQNHVWGQVAEMSVQLMAESDKHGRSLNKSTSRVIPVQSGPSGCTPASTFTFQPGPEGKDARVFSRSDAVNSNVANHPLLPALAWTWNGVPGVMRSFLEFDVSAIPSQAQVLSATLTLYANTITNQQPAGHSQQSGSNEGLLWRVAAPWEESTITWNNQPPVDSSSFVLLPASISNDQTYQIDVTKMVQAMVSQPASNHGFMLQLKTEEEYRALQFWTGDADNPAVRPRLEVFVAGDCP